MTLMATSLLTAGASAIGITPIVAYTVPLGTTSMLLGCTLTNLSGATLPATVIVRNGAVDIHLAKGRRIADSAEILLGKVVLVAGDSVVISGLVDNSFDALVSIAEGV